MRKEAHCWEALGPVWVNIWLAEWSKAHRSSSSRKPTLTTQPHQYTLLSAVIMLRVQAAHMFPTKS